MHSSFRNKYVVSPHSDQTLALLDATKEVDALARVRFLVSFLNTLGPWPSSAEQWPKGPDWQESASESRATPLRGSPTCSSQHVFGLVSGLGSPPPRRSSYSFSLSYAWTWVRRVRIIMAGSQ